MEPVVDIAFDCLPLRAVTRVDVPLDASPAFRARCEHLQRALEAHDAQNAYFLYNTRCVFRLANSDVENMLRFTFDGTVLTDQSDVQARDADLQIELAAETCGGLPASVLSWFHAVIKRAVLIEFDRFIGAGQLAQHVSRIGTVESVEQLPSFSGMNV
jgi:hypothetical protein